jgi:hypothetical protein
VILLLPPDAFVELMRLPLVEVVAFACCAMASSMCGIIAKEAKINDNPVITIVAAVEALIFMVFNKLHDI